MTLRRWGVDRATPRSQTGASDSLGSHHMRSMIRRLFPAALLALALPGCSGTPSPSGEVVSPVQERMFRHFALARDLRSLAVAGDLEQLSATADELASTEETWGMPPGSDAYLEEVRGAARRASDATTLDDAARAVAELAGACGSCHVANDTDLGSRFQTAAPYLDDPDIRHQNYLSWVSRLLWDGLVGPSERTWSAGAEALAAEDGYPVPPAEHVPTEVNTRASVALADLGAQAVEADDMRIRADLLARVWTTCGDCHTQAGVR